MKTLHEESLFMASNKTAALELLKEIRRISEDRFSAGWMLCIEYDLWLTLEQGESRYIVDDEDILALKVTEAWKLGVLHERAGGWWYWLDGEGPMFTTTNRWLDLVKTREKL